MSIPYKIYENILTDDNWKYLHNFISEEYFSWKYRFYDDFIAYHSIHAQCGQSVFNYLSKYHYNILYNGYFI